MTTSSNLLETKLQAPPTRAWDRLVQRPRLLAVLEGALTQPLTLIAAQAGNEVASMGMELLAAPYLDAKDGFYTGADAARARVEHLENMILFWPYMACVDVFQHWAYTHPTEALDTNQCDTQWQNLWKRFMPAVDWSGLEAERATGWHRKLHIFRAPFYYVEYGLAQLGAAQVWRNALSDQAQSVIDYRRALSLGGTATLPELFQTAGAKFAFDAETLGQAVGLIEKTIAELDGD